MYTFLWLQEDESKPNENNGDAAGEATATKDAESTDKAGNGSTPAKEPKDAAAAAANNSTGRGERILQAIRVPLANVGRVFNLKKKVCVGFSLFLTLDAHGSGVYS